MLPTIRKCADDPLKRSFVLPQRILTIQGKVSDQEILLQEQALQIHIQEPQAVTLDNRGSTTPAAILLDFGRELSGGIRLLCASTDNNRYTNVRIRFGESASEATTPLGEKTAGNDHAVRDLVVPVPAMSDQEWGQTGFRFVCIQLEDPDTYIRLKSVLAVYARRDMHWRGSFRCSDPLLEQIYETSAYTCQLCMQHLLWDGIKRDRLVWIGDSHPEMLTIRSVFGRQKMLEDSLDDLVESTPLPGWMDTMPSYSLWWLCILRDWYRYTGDIAYPRRHKDYIQGLTDQLLGYIGEEGAIRLPGHFLDWPTCGSPAAIDGVQALAVMAMQAAAELLELLEDPARQAAATDAVRRLRHYAGDGSGSKAATALLYLADMLPAAKTAEVLRSGGSEGVSTFMSFYILTALARTGGTTEALQILRTYYGGMLRLGATTFWEDFDLKWTEGACPIDRLPQEGEKDIHGDYGAYCYKQFRHSLCHGWSSGPVPFLMESVLGITFDTPGGKAIRLSPCLGDLSWAEGTYPLPGGGELWVRCEQTPDGTKTVRRTPDGITVTGSHPA